jgi:transposase-like protein
MSQMGHTTTLQERAMIAEHVEAGQSSLEIAVALGRPLSTVHKWRQRYLQERHAGLSHQVGFPTVGALATFSPELRAALLALMGDTTALPGRVPCQLAHPLTYPDTTL